MRLLLALLCALLVLAPAAGAASRTQIIRDCEDDSKLEGSYTAAELRDARNNIPSDKDAYSDCRDVLSAALARAARDSATRSGAAGGDGGDTGAGGSGSGKDGSSGGTPGTGAPDTPPPARLDIEPNAPPPVISPEEQGALRDARENLPEVDVRGQKVVAGVRGAAGSAADASLPLALAIPLVLVALMALLALVSLGRRRGLARRSA